MASPSAKTRGVCRPGSAGVSNTRTRSRPCPAKSARARSGLSFSSTGYSTAVMAHIRPASSKTTVTTLGASGSAATNSISNPGGSVKAPCSSSAVSGDCFGGLPAGGAPSKGCWPQAAATKARRLKRQRTALQRGRVIRPTIPALGKMRTENCPLPTMLRDAGNLYEPKKLFQTDEIWYLNRSIMKNAVEPPDLMYLESAKGWYLLGELKEAEAELKKLAPSLQNHPDVLEVRFALHCKAENWPACMDIATAMLEAVPERPTSW